MSWYLAESLVTFRDQIDARYPGRDTSSDGTIGDETHSQNESDHNPNEGDAVTATDITHDPWSGLDCEILAETLREYKDDRIAYIIWNGRICNPDIDYWAWRPYDGDNPHSNHLHLSVKQEPALYDDPSLWEGINDIALAEIPTTVHAPPLPKLVKGMVGDGVRALQLLLQIPNTGVFDEEVQATVIDFQTEMGLVPDGIVGRYTWEELVAPYA